MKRNTVQKKTIRKYLQSVKTHPTAKQVYLEVRKILPNISQGTVYRILKNFKAKGDIHEINSVTNRYDGDLKPHSHFICDKCNKIFDIFENNKINKHQCKFGKITSSQVYYHGVCNKCNK